MVKGPSPGGDGKLRLLCVRVATWCRNNEMEVGMHKCGIMEFEPNDAEGFQLASVLPNEALQANMLLCGQRVPLVNTCTHLGVKITKPLSCLELIAPRLESGRKTVHSLSPFLIFTPS